MRQDIVDAFEPPEDGVVMLTQEQLREMTRFEAEEFGLTYEEAVERGRKRTLPKNVIGMDIESLVWLLDE